MSGGCAIIPHSKRVSETAARTDLGFDSRVREACLFAKISGALGIVHPPVNDRVAANLGAAGSNDAAAIEWPAASVARGRQIPSSQRRPRVQVTPAAGNLRSPKKGRSLVYCLMREIFVPSMLTLSIRPLLVEDKGIGVVLQHGRGQVLGSAFVHHNHRRPTPISQPSDLFSIGLPCRSSEIQHSRKTARPPESRRE
jgi:hypothetical protein